MLMMVSVLSVARFGSARDGHVSAEVAQHAAGTTLQLAHQTASNCQGAAAYTECKRTVMQGLLRLKSIYEHVRYTTSNSSLKYCTSQLQTVRGSAAAQARL